MLLTIISLLLFIGIVFPQSIKVEADKLIYEGNKMIYKGNAVLKKDKGVLKADTIIIYMDEEGKAEKVLAKGNAIYEEENRKATAEEITHDLSKNVIILKGRARVEEGRNYIEAEEIVYYIDTGRAIAEGHGSRVRTFYVEEREDEEVRYSE